MAAFLDVDLKEIAEVVERRRAVAERALLLDRGRLRVALRDNEAAQRRAMFARHDLPRRLSDVVPEADGAIPIVIGEEDAPAILRHAHHPERRPSLAVDGRRGAEIDLVVLKDRRTEVLPPVEKPRLPMLERALESLVGGKVHVVGDFFVVVDRGHGGSSVAQSPSHPITRYTPGDW